MKLKLSIIAGALALAVSAQANAGIAGASTTVGGGDLILSVWDTTSATSYTEDLGISLSSFLASPTTPLSVAADANMTTFLSGATASTTVWNLAAMASGTAFSAYNFLSTAAAGTTPSAISNATVKTYNSSTDGFMAAVALAAGTANSVVVANSANPTAYAGGTTWGSNFGGKANFSNAAGLGVSQSFFSLKPSSASGIGQATVTAFANPVTLSTTGTLSIGTVAAVPEPGEWALMLSGFGLVGFIAARRKKMNTSIAFA